MHKFYQCWKDFNESALLGTRCQPFSNFSNQCSYGYMATKDSFSFSQFHLFCSFVQITQQKIKLPFSRIFFHPLISVYDHVNNPQVWGSLEPSTIPLLLHERYRQNENINHYVKQLVSRLGYSNSFLFVPAH